MAQHKKIICRIRDYQGRPWDVFESRPTEHGWNLLLGRPAIDDAPPLRLRMGYKVIITRELQEYLEQHRMHRAAVQLPISATAIRRLRTELGMNYVADRKRWWQNVKEELLQPDSALKAADPDAGRIETPHKTWPREELARLLEMVEAGESVQSIAVSMNKTLRSVDKVRRQLLGIRKPQSPWSKRDKDTLVQLRDKGLSTKEIALIMGRKKKAVQHKIGKLIPNTTRRCKTWTTEKIDTLRKLVQLCLRTEKIAQLLGRTVYSIRIMRKLFVGPTKKGPKGPFKRTKRQSP